MTNAIYNQTNPHFKSKYADLAAVRHATMNCLTNHGITLTQQPSSIDPTSWSPSFLWVINGCVTCGPCSLPSTSRK